MLENECRRVGKNAKRYASRLVIPAESSDGGSTITYLVSASPSGRQSGTTPHIVVGRKSGQCRLSVLQSLTGHGPVPYELFGLGAGSYVFGNVG